MLRLIFKLVFACAIAAASFYAFKIWMGYRITQQAYNCTTPEKFKQTLGAHEYAAQNWEQTSRIFSCIKGQQNFIDRLFIGIPESWTDSKVPPAWPN